MKRIRKPMLIRFYLSFSLVVILSVSLIAASLYRASVDEIVKAGITEQQNRIEVLAQDFSRQYQAMRETSYSLRINANFRQKYLKQNQNYYQELVDEMAKFKYNTVLTTDFFFYFLNDADMIFYAGSSSHLKPYMQNWFGMEDGLWMAEQLRSTPDGEQLLMRENNDRILFRFPVARSARVASENDGALCYIVSSDSIRERIVMLVNKLPGNIAIRFRGTEIYREEKYALDEAKTPLEIKADSNDGLFTVSLYSSAALLYDEHVLYHTYLLIFFLCAALLLIIVAIPLTILGYRPIHRITRQYADAISGHGGDEMEAIGSMIEEMRRRHSLSQKELKSTTEQVRLQRVRIRRQTLQILLLQPTIRYSLDDLTALGIPLSGSQYCTYALLSEEKADTEALIRLIEDLSDDQLQFYACKISESVAVLVDMPEGETPEMVRELLSAACQMTDASIRIREGSIIETPEAISASFASALTGPEVEEAISAGSDETTEPKRSDKAESIIGYIREHALDYEISRKAVADTFGISEQYLSRLLNQYGGNTYKDILIGERMKRACALLEEGTLSVREVSEMVCYMNPSHFITTFRKATGMTPENYKQEHAKDKEKTENDENS